MMIPFQSTKKIIPPFPFIGPKKLNNSVYFSLLLSFLTPAVSNAQSANPSDHPYTAVIDTGKFYESKGMCLAQKDPSSKSKCLEKLLTEILSVVTESNRKILSNQKEPKKNSTKTPEEIKAEKIAEVNKKWGGVLRSFASIQSATSVGVSYTQYTALLQNFAAEVSLMKSDTDDENHKEIINSFEESISTYKDAATWWSKDIEFYSKSNNRLSYFGGLPFRMVGLDYQFIKYSLPRRNADLLGINEGVPLNLALAKMWSEAEKSAESSKEKLLNTN